MHLGLQGHVGRLPQLDIYLACLRLSQFIFTILRVASLHSGCFCNITGGGYIGLPHRIVL